WCTDGELSPSSRRNRRSAADRPSACGSCATTETAGSRTSASATSSKPISAIRRSSPALRSARMPPIVSRFWLVKNAVGGAASARSSSTARAAARSEEHTSELQSLAYLVCRLLLEKKKAYCGEDPA